MSEEHDHHGHGEREAGEHGGLPHEPAPPEPRHLLPPTPLLLRGLALGGGAVVALGLVRGAWRLSRVLGASVTPIGAVAALLFAWAAAIHLTGGENSDDHPWV